MQKLILLAAAGALGTLARFGVATLAQRSLGDGFPWGTLCVNLGGCFLFGLVFTLWRERSAIDPDTARLILVGFMGAFTTFSSYVSDTLGLVAGARPGTAALNFGVQNLGGIACFVAGAAAGRLG
jgi:CrcB protein